MRRKRRCSPVGWLGEAKSLKKARLKYVAQALMESCLALEAEQGVEAAEESFHNSERAKFQKEDVIHIRNA